MADFLTNLWSSVFTPGATPALIVATNATFAALQILLLALLLATYSVHFAVLSVLCGGLWYGVNWFATELQAAQAKEEEAERLRKARAANKEVKGKGNEWKRKGEVADSEADDEGEDTETEEKGMRESGIGLVNPNAETKAEERSEDAAVSPAGEQSASSVGSGVRTTSADVRTDQSRLRPRPVEDSDRSGYVSSSTDSEWEKVEGGR